MSAKTRTTFVMLLGVGLCAALVAEVGWWRVGLIRLPVPLMAGVAVPVPLLYWGSLALYGWSFGVFFDRPVHERWRWAIRLGLALHLLGLLASLVWDMAHHPGVAALSPWYVRYWMALWGGLLAVGVAAVSRFLVRWRRRGGADEASLFFLPLVWGYAGLWILSLVVSLRFTICATLVGCVGGTMASARIVQVWSARVRTLLANERVFLAAVFLVALAFRLFYTTRIMSNPDYLNTGSDGPAYDALAWELLHGGGPTPWSHIPMFAPGYVRFLALIYWLGGRHYFLVCAVQSVVGALTCLLLYGVAKRLFGLTVARIAAVFGALNFLMIFAATAIGHQAIDPFWTLLVVWCLLRYLEDPHRWGRWIIGIGLLLGWAAVTREGNIVFWLFLIGWFLLGVRAKLGWRTAVLHCLGLSLGFLVILAPFALSFHDGSLQFSARGRLGAQWFISHNSAVDLHTWFNPWQDPTGARALLKAQPVKVVVNMAAAIAGNVRAIFFHQGFGAFDPVFLMRGSLYSYWMWWYAYAAAWVGLGVVLWRALREPVKRLGWWLLLVVVTSRSAVHLLFECAYRHRTPLEPFLIMLAAYGLLRLLQVGRERAVQ